MELIRTPRRKSSKASFWIWMLLLFICVVLSTSGYYGYHWWQKALPNDERIDPQFTNASKPIFYQGEETGLSAIGEQESLKLPYPLVKELIDPNIVYEQASKSVVITTENQVIQFKTGQLNGFVNDAPFSLMFPTEEQEGTVYLPIEPLRQYYGIQLQVSSDTGIVMLLKEGDSVQWGKVLAISGNQQKPVPMRIKATIQAPIVADVDPGEEVMIWEEIEGWYRVQLNNGYVGYMHKSAVVLDHVETIASLAEEPAFVPWKPLGGKINLTWEYVNEFNRSDTSKIGEMPGLNVVSPTWFHLDEEGNVINLADPAYVSWAHSRDYQIWALFSNSFNADWTSDALATYDKRLNVIKQLLSYAELYNLQGINIDFEYVYLKDQDNLSQFVRELTPLLHEQGLVVSIDVTIRGGSEMWSLFADRYELGKIVDYMMVMTYDEHWASSPKAGSVASLPWVKKGIEDIIREDHVPPSKLVLGVPYYTRIWSEQTADGNTKVTSKAVYMDTVEKIIQENKLTPTYLETEKQHYVEYTEGDITNKIWIEDEVSMKARMELVKELNLAGVASWRRGYEQPYIWGVIKDTLEKRP